VKTPGPRRRIRHPLRVGLGVVKAWALSGLVTMVVVGGLQGGAPSDMRDLTDSAGDADGAASSTAYQRVLDRAVADHECSYSGYGEGGTVPASALITTPRGVLRKVSFEVGWDVYNGHRPGTLIAVCLDDVDDGSAQADGPGHVP
jgi:hypothetical protein